MPIRGDFSMDLCPSTPTPRHRPRSSGRSAPGIYFLRCTARWLAFRTAQRPKRRRRERVLVRCRTLASDQPPLLSTVGRWPLLVSAFRLTVCIVRHARDSGCSCCAGRLPPLESHRDTGFFWREMFRWPHVWWFKL